MSKATGMNEQPEARINVRVKGPMAVYLEAVTGPGGLYENQSEYIRDLIRHDMANHEPYSLETGLLEGYAQLAAGNIRKRPAMHEIISRAEREMREEQDG